MTYRILSLDGGGLRGVIALAVLERLDRAVPRWRQGLNMFAGTSTGGFIALGLAKGLTPRQLLDVYVADSTRIFARSLWRGLASLGAAFAPKYGSGGCRSTAQRVFGRDRLGDYLSADGDRGHVVITAFDLVNRPAVQSMARHWKAKVFTNVPAAAPADANDADADAWKVALYTSAAPTYFASFEGFVDGGVFANNPALCALAQALDTRNRTTMPLAAVSMLSLGTGRRPTHLDGDANWGLAQWAPRLVDLLTDGVNEVADFQARQLLGERYRRIQPALAVDIPMDAVDRVEALQRIGEHADIDEAVAFVSRW